jgi:hypothetical protein
MKKSVLIAILIVSVVVFFWAYFPLIEGPFFAPPFEPPVASDCSTPTIQTIWDSIFDETSTGITVIINSSDIGVCNNYYAYKINVNETYALGGTHASSTTNVTQVIAIKGNFTNNTVSQIITNISEFDVNGQHMSKLALLTINVVTYALPETVTSISDAKIRFDNVYKIENSSEFAYDASFKKYNFTFESITTNTTLTLSGEVYEQNATIMLTSYKEEPVVGNCISNWVEVYSSCMIEEMQTVWFNDTNSCPGTTPPENESYGCDYDGNGIIGDPSNMNLTNIAVDVYIGGEILDPNKSYSSPAGVEFREGSIRRVEFHYDFGAPLNFKSIEIEKQPSSSKTGYIIFNGVNVEKEIKIDQINSASSRVCVRDANIGSISEACNETNEKKIKCDGLPYEFACEIDNSTFVVSFLNHSGVREHLGGCLPTWECSTWNACFDNQQTRTCTDINSCNTTSNKPIETQVCSACTPNWDCTPWNPEECISEEGKTRVCTDTNSCGTEEGKPPEETSCTEKKSSNTTLLIILIASILFVSILAIIAYFIFRKKSPQPNNPPGFPPKPPRQLYPSPQSRPGFLDQDRF